jgi:hypothetical protein
LLENFDIDYKGVKASSSPKSAHHAMGLEAADFDEEFMRDSDERSPQKENYGETEEEQRKGLWRSIFGYFRGPKMGA